MLLGFDDSCRPQTLYANVKVLRIMHFVWGWTWTVSQIWADTNIHCCSRTLSPKQVAFSRQIVLFLWCYGFVALGQNLGWASGLLQRHKADVSQICKLTSQLHLVTFAMRSQSFIRFYRYLVCLWKTLWVNSAAVVSQSWIILIVLVWWRMGRESSSTWSMSNIGLCGTTSLFDLFLVRNKYCEI